VCADDAAQQEHDPAAASKAGAWSCVRHLRGGRHKPKSALRPDGVRVHDRQRATRRPGTAAVHLQGRRRQQLQGQPLGHLRAAAARQLQGALRI